MTTDTSAEAVDSSVRKLGLMGLHGHKDLTKALAAERDALLDTHTDKADAWDMMAKKNETIAALRLSLAEARNAALDEAISEVHQECWTDGNGGPATETLLAEQATTNLAIMSIRALKTPTGDKE